MNECIVCGSADRETAYPAIVSYAECGTMAANVNLKGGGLHEASFVALHFSAKSPHMLSKNLS